MKTIFLSFRARRSSARLFCPVSRNFRFVYFGRTAKRHANKQHEIRCRDTSHSDSWTSRALTHVDILFGSFDEKICFTYGKIAHMRCEAVFFSIPFSHAKAWLWMEELLRKKKKKKKLSAGFLLVLFDETEKTRMNDMNFVTFICFREAKKKRWNARKCKRYSIFHSLFEHFPFYCWPKFRVMRAAFWVLLYWRNSFICWCACLHAYAFDYFDVNEMHFFPFNHRWLSL